MFDHVGLSCKDVNGAKEFYATILEPLGIKLLKDYAPYAYGFGDKEPQFWVAMSRDPTKSTTLAHIAFKASSTELVKKVYDLAITSGATDNGAPGPRPQYGPNYYGAFFFDKDGNNIEVTFHGEF